MATQINININGFGTHLNGAPRSGSLRDRRVSGYSERVIDTEPVTRWQDEFYTLKPGFSPVGYLHAERKLKKKKKKNCSNGQVCGFSCISKSKTCTANMTTAQFMEHNKAKRLAAAEKRKAAKAAKMASTTIGPSSEVKTYQEAIERGKAMLPSDVESRVTKLNNLQGKIEEAQKKYDEAYQREWLNVDLAGDYKSQMKVLEERVSKEREDWANARTNYNKEKEEFASYMESARQAIIMKSRISKEDAAAIVDKITFEKSVGKTKTTKDGTGRHDPDDVKNSLIEFYQITNGNGAIIENVYMGKARANAESPVVGDAKNRLNLGTPVKSEVGKKESLFHEAAHYVELQDVNNAVISSKWVESRATGGTSKRGQETFLNGNFYDPYVGKIYREYIEKDGRLLWSGSLLPITEAISTGAQHLATGESMVKLLSKDPEHLYFALGIISK